ncbi:MAG: GldG family protein [Oligoflexia bacterium]|nr:GldG family protein [Oligoflexia bacterium]
MKAWSWILGFIGGAGVLAFLAYAVFVDTIQTPYAVAGGVALALIATWVALDWGQLQHTLRARGTRHNTNATLLVIVVGAIAVAVNVLASRYDDRVDLTASQRFALSEQTLKVLGGLDQDVDVLAFFLAGSPEESAFRDQIEGYTNASDHIQLVLHDPVREPLAAEQNHITSSTGTVVLKVGDSTQRLESDFGEEALTNGLIRVTSGKQHPVCAISGHGELDISDQQSPNGLGMAVSKLEGQNYTVRSVELLREGGVPDDCDLVLVADPRTDLLPPERERLAAYVAGGGALLVLLDPNHAPDFAADMDRYGIRVGDDIVVESNPKYQLVGGDPTYLVLDSESFSPHDITKGVVGMALFRVARSVGIGSEVAGIKVSVLARTSPYGWAETTLDGVTEPKPDGGDTVGNVPLIALAEVTDPAAITVGSRALGSDAAGATAVPLAPQNKTTADIPRKAGGRIVVFGDSDFAVNELLPQGNNQDLLLNTIAWMVGEDDQVSIRPNGAGSGLLTMNFIQSLGVWLLCLLVVPGITIGMAIGTWRRRRAL